MTFVVSGLETVRTVGVIFEGPGTVSGIRAKFPGGEFARIVPAHHVEGYDIELDATLSFEIDVPAGADALAIGTTGDGRIVSVYLSRKDP